MSILMNEGAFRITTIGDNCYMIDLCEGGKWERTAAYVFRGVHKTALIETGTSHSIPYVRAALSALSIAPENLDAIIVTHVHLDHAGGVGHLLDESPRATVYAHPRGGRHLIDPARLLTGAKTVYGDSFDRVCGPMKPVPHDRLVVCPDGFSLDLGGRTLTMIDSPGHAKHHMCIYDDLTGYLCSGDVFGILYSPSYTGWRVRYLAPSTSPTEFDPDATALSLKKTLAYDVQALLHGHFGVNYAVKETAARITRIIRQFAALGEDGAPQDVISERLREWYTDDLRTLGFGDCSISALEHDVWLNSMGIAHYVSRKQ